MDNYFRARDILDKAMGTDAYFQIKSILFSLKAADVVEVRHGRWVDKKILFHGMNVIQSVHRIVHTVLNVENG